MDKIQTDTIHDLIATNRKILDAFWIKAADRSGDGIKTRYEMEFQWNMYKAQIAMIRTYFHHMNRETSARALNTIAKIESQLDIINV